MNFTFTWIMDKLGYMPKIDLEIGKLKLDPKEVWPFPVPEDKPKVAKKKPAAKKPTLKKATTRKPKAK